MWATDVPMRQQHYLAFQVPDVASRSTVVRRMNSPTDLTCSFALVYAAQRRVIALLRTSRMSATVSCSVKSCCLAQRGVHVCDSRQFVFACDDICSSEVRARLAAAFAKPTTLSDFVRRQCSCEDAPALLEECRKVCQRLINGKLHPSEARNVQSPQMGLAASPRSVCASAQQEIPPQRRRIA